MRISRFEELATAMRRFEELFGAPEGAPEAIELSEIADALRAFEDEVAALITAERMAAKGVLRIFPASFPPPSNLA
jgi:hypothetical protein